MSNIAQAIPGVPQLVQSNASALPPKPSTPQATPQANTPQDKVTISSQAQQALANSNAGKTTGTNQR